MFSKSLKDFFKNPIITIPNIIYVGITQLLIFLLFGNISDNLLYNNVEFDPQAAATVALSFLLFLIISLFVTPFIFSWSAFMAKRTVDGEKPSIIESLKESLKYYWRVLGVTVLIGLIIFAVYFLMVIILAITVGVSFLASPQQLSSSTGLLLIVLAIVFILGFVFLAIALSPIHAVLVYDNLSVGDAFSKGFKLGTKKFFPILGFSLLIALSTGLILLALNTAFGENSTVVEIIVSLLGGYLAILPTIFTLNLYRENKSRDEYNSNLNYTNVNNTETYQQWNDIYNKDEISNENTQIPEKEDENKPDDNNFRI